MCCLVVCVHRSWTLLSSQYLESSELLATLEYACCLFLDTSAHLQQCFVSVYVCMHVCVHAGVCENLYVCVSCTYEPIF